MNGFERVAMAALACATAYLSAGFEPYPFITELPLKQYNLKRGEHKGGFRVDERIDVTIFCDRRGLYYNSFVERKGKPHYEHSVPQKRLWGMEFDPQDRHMVRYMVTCDTSRHKRASRSRHHVSRK
jgi:hypothetical protein